MDVERLKQQDREEGQGGHLADDSIGKSTRQKHRDGAILKLQVRFSWLFGLFSYITMSFLV